MSRFVLETRRVTHYTVTVEANSIEEAEEMVKDWVSDDFEEFPSSTEWIDGEFVEEEVTE